MAASESRGVEVNAEPAYEMGSSVASLDSLKVAIRECLSRRGSLGKVEAAIRTEVFKTLEAERVDARPQPKTHQLTLAIEVCRQFLSGCGFEHAAHTLELEAGLTGEALPSDFLCRELNIDPHAVAEDGDEAIQGDIPLLLRIVSRLNAAKHL